MKNILVTGGSGFIASNLINYLLDTYSDIFIVNLDAMYYCASKHNVTAKKNYQFIKGNINSKDLVNHILHEHQIETVIHMAAQSHVDHSFSNPLQYTFDNVSGTHTLLESVRQYGKIKKFIHVSTDEVYGQSRLNEDGKTEQSILCPTNPYSATKAAAELIAMSYYHSYKMPIVITRGNNVYGERQFPEKVIPKFILALLNNEKCTLHGQGKSYRSFIHVHDVAKAFDVVLTKGKIGEIYNIGTDYEITMREFAIKLIGILKPDEDPKDWIEYVKDRNFNDLRYNINSSKLEGLGFNVDIPFEEGIRKTIEWYKSIDVDTYWT
jgi:UDP-glucose 4,6-dehydratase